VRLFQVLHEGAGLNQTHRDRIMEILLAQEFRAMIPAGLPAEARVAHKTGEISTVAHDAGIVSLPGRKPYVLAILTEFGPSDTDHNKPVAEISRLVFESVSGSA
jgi:beta-lactamase class A